MLSVRPKSFSCHFIRSDVGLGHHVKRRVFKQREAPDPIYFMRRVSVVYLYECSNTLGRGCSWKTFTAVLASCQLPVCEQVVSEGCQAVTELMKDRAGLVADGFSALGLDDESSDDGTAMSQPSQLPAPAPAAAEGVLHWRYTCAAHAVC